ncbi:MAG TPA: electron transfer flavoprotein subunit alpha/FixB family protein [Dehalococcoidia bacterium]|nr:electron transfer flavoprotein subunit alpha/FixB family protein [Dehalococcoidia bacterium]
MSSVVVASWGAETAGEGAREALSVARRIAAAAGDELVWFILGSLPEEGPAIAARYGVTRLDHAPAANLEGSADRLVTALTQYHALAGPGTLVLSQEIEVRLVAPRLAARLEAGVVMNVLKADASADGALAVTATAFGGDTHAVYAFAGEGLRIIGLLPRAVAAEPAETPSAPEERRVDLSLEGIDERITVVTPASASGPRLEDAALVVSGGRGLGEPEQYRLIEELAAALGGVAGASRPIVDDGWTNAARQVGLTGRITRPDCYIAVGISGASQHMAGCSAAKVLVAINRDPNAPIFRHARYGIVADYRDIVPELIAAARGPDQS